jgi:16S rRNA (guanine(1405)-N(7))-methyltransferase
MSDLDQLVETVRESAKYQHLSPEVIRRVGSLELAKYPRMKEAVKSTKNKLHQIGGAYLSEKMPYGRWTAALEEVASDREALLAKCREIMPHHASTRERLPILDEFYQVTLGDIAPVQSVIDIACGLNPLTIPWMPLDPNAHYYAYDIYEDMIGFVQGFMNLIGIQGEAEAHDMGAYIPSQTVDLALILKTLPCLEQVDKQTSLRLIDGLNARHLLISYPVRSLGGSNKGMAENYEAHLERLLADKSWTVQRYEFKTELAFLVTKA